MRRFKVFKEIDCAYSTTCTIVEWLPVFISTPYLEIIINSLNFCRNNKGIALNAYVIMPNHLHAITWSEEGVNLSDVMRDFKRFTSRAISSQLQADGNALEIFAEAASNGRGKSEHKVWQDEFHPEAIYSMKFWKQKVDYIHGNSVRKGFVAEPEQWVYSSARNYYVDDNSLIEVEMIVRRRGME